MNFDAALQSHTEWKQKLNSYISKPDHSLKASEVAADFKCELGKWLDSQKRNYGSLPEFVKLTAEHTRVSTRRPEERRETG